MRQFIFNILILFSVASSAFAQKIAIDEENAYGKFIATDFMPIYNADNGTTGSLSLGVAYNSAMQTLFCLNLKVSKEQNIKISKGSALQVITNEGEIIVLHNTSDIADADPIDNSVIVSYGVQYNEIELASLDKIMNERIVKIKIETDNGILTKDITNNMFSKSVYSCFIILKNYLERIKDE